MKLSGPILPSAASKTDTPETEKTYQLDEPELVRMREERAARLRDLEPFNPRMKRRWKHYVIGAVICFPLVTWFFSPIGFRSLWIQILISAAYGSYVALARPTGSRAVLATLTAGFAMFALTGPLTVGFGFLMSMFVYALIGAFIGIGEESKRFDGR